MSVLPFSRSLLRFKITQVDFCFVLQTFVSSMAFQSSKTTYPCADCGKEYPAMKLFAPMWEDLAYGDPQTIAEALHQHKATGKVQEDLC